MQLGLAEARQQRLERIAVKAQARTLRLWRQRMGADFDSGWASMSGDVVRVAAAAQVAAATGATPYLTSTARADGVTGPYGGPVEPLAWAGVDASGRTLEGLLFGAVTTAKDLIGKGAGLQSALTGGGMYLSTMTTTAVMDAGRSSDLTAMTSRSYTHYVRVVSPGACSRCAILAGMQTSAHTFRRHPGCKCGQAPETETEQVPHRYASPADYFDSLPAAEQDRVFTKAGAAAIRAGADPIAVVSARRGAAGVEYGSAILDGHTLPNSGRRLVKSRIGTAADGSPILGYTTGEGTTVRGAFAKQQAIAGTGTRRVGDSRYSSTKRIRLMPEQIVSMTDDVELRKVLLRDAGYLRFTPTAEEMHAPLGGGYSARKAELIREDRAVADQFYRSKGVQLG